MYENQDLLPQWAPCIPILFFAVVYVVALLFSIFICSSLFYSCNASPSNDCQKDQHSRQERTNAVQEYSCGDAITAAANCFATINIFCRCGSVDLYFAARKKYLRRTFFSHAICQNLLRNRLTITGRTNLQTIWYPAWESQYPAFQ